MTSRYGPSARGLVPVTQVDPADEAATEALARKRALRGSRPPPRKRFNWGLLLLILFVFVLLLGLFYSTWKDRPVMGRGDGGGPATHWLR